MIDLRTEDDLRAALDRMGRDAPSVQRVVAGLRDAPRRGASLLATVTAVVLIAIVTVIYAHARLSDVHQPGGSRETRSPTPAANGLVIPQCRDRPTGTTSIHVALQGSNAAFSRHCYHVAAGRQLTLTFTNDLIPSEGGHTIVGLVISPADHPAFHPLANRKAGSWYGGSTASAVFTTDPITSPATARYQIPPLPAGTYVIQTDTIVLTATLTVG